MTTTIYDLAHQLERSIRALPEYQAVLAAKAKITEDKTVNPLFEEFMTAQTQLQEQLQLGQLPSQEEQEALQELGQRIEATPLLKDYFEQQQRLYVYIADLEKIIFSPLKELGD